MKNERNNESVTLSKEEIDGLFHQYEVVTNKMAAINAKYGKGDAK